jgi:hypothetical protein
MPLRAIPHFLPIPLFLPVLFFTPRVIRFALFDAA